MCQRNRFYLFETYTHQFYLIMVQKNSRVLGKVNHELAHQRYL